jgi:hypothetical protein
MRIFEKWQEFNWMLGIATGMHIVPTCFIPSENEIGNITKIRRLRWNMIDLTLYTC